jgi:RNA polymerase sigma factor (sigma-70 family)
VQECLLVAERNLKNFRGRDATTFRAWLKGIQHNLIRKLVDRQLPKISREVALRTESSGGIRAEASGTQPLMRMLQREKLDLLKRALDALDIDDRRLIERRFLQSGKDDPSYDEIARELGTNAGQLRKQICRILKRLDTGMTLLEQLDRQGMAPHYCRVLCWRHFRSWSVARIAAELGCPEQAAKSLLNRASGELMRTID